MAGQIGSVIQSVLDHVQMAEEGEERGEWRRVIMYLSHALCLRVLHDMVWNQPNDGTYRVEPPVILRAIDHALELRYGCEEDGWPVDAVRYACRAAYRFLTELDDLPEVDLRLVRDGPLLTVHAPQILGVALETIFTELGLPFVRAAEALRAYSVKPAKERMDEGVCAAEDWTESWDGDAKLATAVHRPLTHVMENTVMRFELRPFDSYETAHVPDADLLEEAEIPFVRVREDDVFYKVRIEDCPAFFAFVAAAYARNRKELSSWGRCAVLAKKALAPREYRPPVTRNPQVVRELLRVVMEERSREDSEEREE